MLRRTHLWRAGVITCLCAMLFALGLQVSLAGAARAATLTTISNLAVADSVNAGNWSLQANLQVGNTEYGDRAFTFTSVPASLAGANWIRTANSSKQATNNPLVTFSINQASDIAVAVDIRLGKLAWMDASWTDTGTTLVNSESPVKTFAVFSKTFPAGTVTLGPNAANTNLSDNYTIVVTATAAWTQYLHDVSGSDYNSGETTLNVNNFPNLTQKWTATGGGGMSAQPIAINNAVYWGSWDGNMHATTITGANAGKDIWTTNLGTTTDNSCNPTKVGVASTAALGYIGTTPTIFVGGGGNDAAVGKGNVYLYAINANTGAITWKATIGTAPQDFAWSSPVIYGGNVYFGMASFGDCPLTRGRVYKVSEANGTIASTFYTEPAGCTAGGIWGTPTIDAATGMLFTATGTQSSCAGQAGDYAVSLLEINTATMTYVANWQLPAAQQISDADFGSAPTLFTGTIAGASKNLVGVANKNGIFYTFDRSNITKGPVWQKQIANSGACPQCGDGSLSPAVWDGTTLYAAGGTTTINGTSCRGSVRAIDPSTGTFKWEHCLTSGPVIASLTASPGVVVATEGAWVIAMNMSTGATLFRYQDLNSGATYYSPVTIANGHMFAANLDGAFVAFGL